MIGLYLGFLALVGMLLALDLGVFHRRDHAISIREALGWSLLWIALGLAFGAFVHAGYSHHWLGLGLHPDRMAGEPTPVEGVGLVYNNGRSALLKYLTGYLLEKSLAVDNIFVIALIFGAFGVRPRYQHRVLFWGIVGALVLRGVLIALGAALLARFDWVVYVFGAFLVATALRMLVHEEQAPDPGSNAVVRLVRRLVPVTARHHGPRFFVRAGNPDARLPAEPGEAAAEDPVVAAAAPGRLLATPLLVALVTVEVADVVFAMDSIPAILAITADPFLVFTSNVFAILGLRSLYFALASMITAFRYLKTALAAVLLVVGAKMLAHGWLLRRLGESYTLWALALIAGILGLGVLASLLWPEGRGETP